MKLIYLVEWHGEPEVGINSGSEEVTISFKYGQTLSEDVIEFWRQSIEEFYDGANVELLDTEE